MNAAGTTLALILLLICAALWVRAMYHQWTYTESIATAAP